MTEKLDPQGAVPLAADGQSEFGIQEAALALLKNGDVAAVWVAAIGGVGRVFGRVVKPEGAAASAEFEVQVDDLNVYATSPTVAALADGGFVIAWGESVADGSRYAVGARIYNANGLPRGGPLRLLSSRTSGFQSPKLAALAGGFVMVYARFGDAPGVMAQMFSAAGKSKGAAVRIDAPNDRRHDNPRIAPRIGGGFAVAWLENVYSTAGGLPVVSDTTIKGRFLSPQGAAEGGFEVEDAVREKSRERSHALVDTKAGLLVAWTLSIPRDADSFDDDIRGALVSDGCEPSKIRRLTRTSAAHEGGACFGGLLRDGRAPFGFGARDASGDTDPHGAFGALVKTAP